jgi:hypothetical protein
VAPLRNEGILCSNSNAKANILMTSLHRYFRMSCLVKFQQKE